MGGGHRALSREGWWLAALLSVGGDARLDGPSACQAYEVFKRRIGRIHVVTSHTVRPQERSGCGARPGSRPRRRRQGHPVVPIEEALLGLAADRDVTNEEVRRALRKSMTETHTTFERLRRHATKAKGQPGHHAIPPPPPLSQ